MTSFKFRVVLCPIGLFPTLISKIRWLGSELPPRWWQWCWWPFFQYNESVINVSNLSPTDFVSNIRHQHRFNPQNKLFSRWKDQHGVPHITTAQKKANIFIMQLLINICNSPSHLDPNQKRKLNINTLKTVVLDILLKFRKKKFFKNLFQTEQQKCNN